MLEGTIDIKSQVGEVSSCRSFFTLTPHDFGAVVGKLGIRDLD